MTALDLDEHHDIGAMAREQHSPSEPQLQAFEHVSTPLRRFGREGGAGMYDLRWAIGRSLVPWSSGVAGVRAPATPRTLPQHNCVYGSSPAGRAIGL